jgi:homoserine dehydrogenase
MVVEPYAVNKNNPLYSISDVFNGILVKGKVSGDLMFYGKGAGKLPTAGAVVSDIIDIGSRGNNQPPQPMWTADDSKLISSLPDDLVCISEAELGKPVI